ncbi:S1/P1 nuclease [Vaginella massiliensis]|uniref:S1/P1 nuclease n=1 Tax=Vaginella massiliensis TaxID=1816680 RepID=UPI0008398A92|nr:S1/P1 nuclease [Vaginella massiliensis]
MKRIIIMSSLLSLVWSTEAKAWGLTGHRVIAEIAENHLNRKARKNIKSLIDNQRMAYWANWPDFVKSDPNFKHADPYHYVNIEGNLSRAAFDQALKDSSEDNLYKRSLFLIDELKNNQSLSKAKKQEYLYYLIHILGDAHQPLHVGRSEDMGGNRIKVEWFKKPTNIHSVWDTDLVDFEKYSFTEYSMLLNFHPKKYNESLQQGWIEDWLYDSYQVANSVYANVKMDDKLGYRYHFDNKYTVENQLLKGGLRLSKVLNYIYK